MGITLSQLFLRYFGRWRPMKILMVGLDDAGKTTILYRLHLKQFVETIPTIGYHVENIRIKQLLLTVWDINGRDKHFRILHHFFMNTRAIIFVVNSKDVKRIDQARDELFTMLSNVLLQDVALLILANKQDLPKAMTVDEITKRLELNSIKNHEWHIQPTSATNGKDLFEGLHWLADKLNEKF